MKSRNHTNHRNHLNQSSDCGFSLVELLVVVSIVAILSVSSVIGFGYLGNTLKAREAAGFISDIVKQEELKVLRGDFDKAVVHILTNYLVIEEWPTGAVDTLSLDSLCSGDSPDYRIVYSESGNLTQKNGDGEVILIKPVTVATSPECVNFKSQKDLEWNYQLTSGGQASAILRFVHFNLQRDSEAGGLWVTENPNSRIEIFAPYARKRFFKGSASVDILQVAVGNTYEGVTEPVTFQ